MNLVIWLQKYPLYFILISHFPRTRNVQNLTSSHTQGGGGIYNVDEVVEFHVSVVIFWAIKMAGKIQVIMALAWKLSALRIEIFRIHWISSFLYFCCSQLFWMHLKWPYQISHVTGLWTLASANFRIFWYMVQSKKCILHQFSIFHFLHVFSVTKSFPNQCYKSVAEPERSLRFASENVAKGLR